eukprot:5271058-Prymnesium_polylepis.1
MQWSARTVKRPCSAQKLAGGLRPHLQELIADLDAAERERMHRGRLCHAEERMDEEPRDLKTLPKKRSAPSLG